MIWYDFKNYFISLFVLLSVFSHMSSWIDIFAVHLTPSLHRGPCKSQSLNQHIEASSVCTLCIVVCVEKLCLWVMTSYGQSHSTVEMLGYLSIHTGTLHRHKAPIIRCFLAHRHQVYMQHIYCIIMYNIISLEHSQTPSSRWEQEQD